MEKAHAHRRLIWFVRDSNAFKRSNGDYLIVDPILELFDCPGFAIPARS